YSCARRASPQGCSARKTTPSSTNPSRSTAPRVPAYLSRHPPAQLGGLSSWLLVSSNRRRLCTPGGWPAARRPAVVLSSAATPLVKSESVPERRPQIPHVFLCLFQQRPKCLRNIG